MVPLPMVLPYAYLCTASLPLVYLSPTPPYAISALMGLPTP